jgi:hypothetical protein
MVVRRIHMNLDKWDKLDRSGREQSVGRTLSNGAPLTGTQEHDEPDFEAKTSIGFPVIPEFSHMRRARPDDTTQRIFRRAYNYDERPAGSDVSDSDSSSSRSRPTSMRSSRPSSVDWTTSTCSTNGPLPSDRPCSPCLRAAPRADTSGDAPRVTAT